MARPLRILVADDHAAFRRVLRSLLGPFDAEVLECRDGREAVQRFDAFAPDWVLMDLEMPGLDGLSATRQIKHQHPNARVVLLMADADADVRAAAHEAGVCQIVLKEKLECVPAILFPPSPSAKDLS
jgi:CheY-like chemotaxis protein